MNAINDWIRGGNTPKGKDKRRYIIAGICIVAGLALALYTYGISLILVGIGIWKIKNAILDDT